MPATRSVFFICFLMCVGLLIAGAYMQVDMKLDPCPLCIMQRIIFIGLAILFFLATIHKVKLSGHRLYCILIFILSGLGIYFGARHVWIQALPPDAVASCGPSLGYMLKNFPLSDTLKLLFTGSGECYRVQWSFLGLSIAGWALVWSIIFSVVAIWQFFRKPIRNTL